MTAPLPNLALRVIDGSGRDATWRPIPGHPWYEVSSIGDVRSFRVRGSDTARASEPRLLAQHQVSAGYYKVHLRTLGSASQWVHRMVALAFFGPCPQGQEVRHLDGDRSNNAVENLAYGTRSENNQDVIRHGHNTMLNRTHCPEGHPYDDENTSRLMRRRTGGRVGPERACRTCQRSKSRRSRAKRVGTYAPCDRCGEVVSVLNISRHRKTRKCASNATRLETVA